MKKLLTVALLTTVLTVNAQKEEYFTASVSIDPTATVKESSPNLVGEIELVSKWGYVKASSQILPDLEGGYVDLAGAMGFNIYLNRWKTPRIYFGGRLGTIFRGGSQYPLAGLEAGVDFDIVDNMFIGLRATRDYREDFSYWGGEAENRYSGFIRMGFKF